VAHRTGVSIALLLAIGLAGETARAQVDVRALLRAHAGQELPSAFRRAGSNALGVTVELPNHAPAPPGLTSLAPGLALFVGDRAQVADLAAAHPDWSFTWSPPLRPMINVATETTGAVDFRQNTGLSGKGAIIGLVDTGFDPRHADLRDEIGHTRVAWVLDLSQPPAGLHPELEAEYGCTSEPASQCAVFDGVDVDTFIADKDPHLVRDTLGHGTHVASIALGNGLSVASPKYVGMAPDATLVAVRVTRGGGGTILDPDVLLAARFVFDRAAELKMPAVVNLSLGSDFGGHDGQTALERGLASMVGPGHPGRAIVVAAGNSGAVYTGLTASYPPPFGVYTEVHVPRQSSVRVPVLSPDIGKPTTNGTIYVWIAQRSGDALDVGVDDADGTWVAPLPPGESGAFKKDDVTASVINQSHEEASPVPAGSNGMVVVIEGTWPTGQTFAVRLEGHGSARLWVQSDGDLSPGVTSAGALFPRASKEGTVGIPASSSALIAAGATVNRLTWVDREKEKLQVQQFGSMDKPVVDSTAYFSGAGPNSLGEMKPDISAPGAFVIGAMSSLADPKKNGGGGIFASSAACSGQPGCLVVDDYHGISTGTSMAAPMVSGAIALLFQKDPTLTQDRIRTLLQAGARRPTGVIVLEQELGPGELDLLGTLAVMDSESAPISALPDVDKSWLALTSSYAHPDESWPLLGYLELRDADKGIADGFDANRLSLHVDGGSVDQPLRRVAAGLWRFGLVAPSGSGGSKLSFRIDFDGKPLVTRTVPVAVDRWVATGEIDARGGCATRSGRGGLPAFLLAALSLSIVLLRRCNGGRK
jgi:subtilisin family serine protease